MIRFRFRSALAAAALLSLAGCAQLAAPFLKPDVTAEPASITPGAYTLDPAHASIVFKIDHLGYSNYIGRFERFDAALDFDAGDPAPARIEAVIDMTSLDIANDEFAEELMGPQWFDTERYPEAVFRNLGLKVVGENTAVISGDLTLHGVRRAIEVNATFNGGAQDRLRGAYVVGFSASAVIDRTDFGIDRFAGLIANDVTIEIEAEFVKE